MRRNSDYMRCCENGGAGELAALYADFGDLREDDFHKWWTGDDRGVRLFGEQPLSVKFCELHAPVDWQPHWSNSDVLVLAVPLRMSKRKLKGLFAKVLDARHTGKQGRQNISLQESSARYRLARNYTIRNLQTTLDVYDRWLANQQVAAGLRQTLWQIGVDAGLSKRAAKDAVSDSTQDRLVGRNLLGALVGRYVRQAKALVANSALGKFPVH